MNDLFTVTRSKLTSLTVSNNLCVTFPCIAYLNTLTRANPTSCRIAYALPMHALPILIMHHINLELGFVAYFNTLHPCFNIRTEKGHPAQNNSLGSIRLPRCYSLSLYMEVYHPPSDRHSLTKSGLKFALLTVLLPQNFMHSFIMFLLWTNFETC